MQNKMHIPDDQLSPKRKRGLDIHPLSSGKKNSFAVQPKTQFDSSTGNFIERKNNENPFLYQSTVDAKTAMAESRVVVKENELVEFAKKFAVEKADSDERIQGLQKQLFSLKTSYVKIDQQYRNLLSVYRHREHRESQLLGQTQKIKDEATKNCCELQERIQQKQIVLGITQKQNIALRKDMEDLQDRLYRQNEEIKRMQKEHGKVIGERVLDLIKLNKELEAAKKEIRNLQTDKMKASTLDFQNKQKIDDLNKQINELSIESNEQKIRTTILLEEISRLSSIKEPVPIKSPRKFQEHDDKKCQDIKELAELKKKIHFLQTQNDKLRQKLKRQGCQIERDQVIYENQILSVEVNDKNKKIFDLTSQVGNLKRHIKTLSQESSPIHQKPERQEQLIAKCGQLEGQIEILNKRIVQLEEEKGKQILYEFEDLPFFHINPQSKQNLACEEVSEEQSSQADSSCCAENPQQEYEEQKKVLTVEPIELKNISPEHQALRESIVNMEILIEALRKQNEQLREGAQRKKIFLKRTKQTQVLTKEEEEKFRQLEKERFLLIDQNQYLKDECNTLQNEMAELKARIVDLKITQEENSETSPIQPGRRQQKLSLLLKKIAEYSRQIISDRYNPLQFELYGTIFNKFMKQIELLQGQRDQAPIASPRQPARNPQP